MAAIPQLEQARKIVLADPSHYPDIITGITPIIGSGATLEVQRWGADFMAETFASPIITGTMKEKMCTAVIATLKDWLENQNDEAVLRSAIQTSASIYPYVFRFVTNNPTAFQVWETTAAIKSKILQRWDSAPIGVRICCIKYVQRVVQVQTPGIIADPRRPEQNEISLAIVPRDHPIVQLPRLEAEASGLLDRLLGVFQEAASDAIIVDATINCIMVLVRTRQAVSNKIMSAVLSFNPFKGLPAPITAKDKVRIKSVERTIRAFLIFYARRNQQSQFHTRIQQYIDRNIAQRLELEGGQSRKRGAPEMTDGLDDAKRQKLGAQLNGKPAYPPMPPPPLSLAQVFTLTTDQTGSFDARALDPDMVQKITVALLQRLDPNRLAGAMDAVRNRLLDLDRIAAAARAKEQPAQADDDEYEPEFEPQEDVEQVTNRLDAAPAVESKEPDDIAEVALGSFTLPRPPPISKEEAEQLAKSSIGRVFTMIESVDQPSKPEKAGANRLAGSQFDGDAWVTLITRLATRAPSSVEQLSEAVDATDTSNVGSNGSIVRPGSFGENIRNTLFEFIVTDFRHRLPIAISWLCEEWYNEKVYAKAHDEAGSNGTKTPSSNYEEWADRILDSISPYLDAKDVKFLVRFLSEIPELRSGIFTRVKSIANDPDRAALAVNSLYYLVMFKPPAKEQALDAIEDLYRNYQGASVHARRALAKFRPECLEDEAQSKTEDPQVKTEPANSATDKSDENTNVSQTKTNRHGSPAEAAQENALENGQPAESQVVVAAG